MQIRSLPAALVFLVFCSCATTVHKDPFYLNMSGNTEMLDGINFGGQDCTPVLEKKIGYALFALPMNRFSEEELRPVRQQYSTIRYREVAYGSDIALSALGFLVTIIVKTGVIEGCGRSGTNGLPPFKMFQLLEAEKDRVVPLGEYAVQFKSGGNGSAKTKDVSIGDRRYRISHSVILRDIRSLDKRLTGNVDGFLEKADADALYVSRAEGDVVWIPRLSVLKILVFFQPSD